MFRTLKNKLRARKYNKKANRISVVAKRALIIMPWYGEDATSKNITEIAKTFKELGYQVDVVLYSDKIYKINSVYFDNSYYIVNTSKKFGNWNLHPENEEFANNNIDDWVADQDILKLKEIQGANRYNLVLCNYVFLSKFLTIFQKDVLKLIYTHDLFAYRNKKIKLNGGQTDSFFFSCTPSEEKKGLLRADLILNIQEKESEIMKGYGLTIPIRTLPYLGESRFSVCSKVSVGYFASSHHPNIIAINKLIDELESRNLINKNFELLIAGSICQSERDIKKAKYVKFLGYVSDVDEFYSRCNLIINPDELESGLKIKTVEGLSYGLPVICTSAASTGIPVKEPYHLCRSVKQCVDWILYAIQDKERLNEIQAESQRVYINFKKTYIKYNILNDSINTFIKSETIYDNKKNNSLERPKVSVIVPVYNVGKYLDQAILSILNQTFRNFEIIAIDDGSIDNSASILDFYSKIDSRVHVTHKKNEGYGVAVNFGLSQASGQYIYIVEPDDFIHKSTLEKLVSIMDNGNYDFVKSDFNRIYINRPVSTAHIFGNDLKAGEVVEINNCKKMEYILAESSIWSCLYRKDFLDNYKIKMSTTPGATYQDAVWKFQVFSVAKNMSYINEPLYNYRIMSDGSSSSSNRYPTIVFHQYSVIMKFLIDQGVFTKLKETFYAHMFLDFVFHFNRLNLQGREEFKKEAIVWVNNAENQNCSLNNIVYPESMKAYIKTEVQKVYDWVKSDK